MVFCDDVLVSVLVDLLCGFCCLLSGLVVGESIATVVAGGEHVVFLFCCC